MLKFRKSAYLLGASCGDKATSNSVTFIRLIYMMYYCRSLGVVYGSAELSLAGRNKCRFPESAWRRRQFQTAVTSAVAVPRIKTLLRRQHAVSFEFYKIPASLTAFANISSRDGVSPVPGGEVPVVSGRGMA